MALGFFSKRCYTTLPKLLRLLLEGCSAGVHTGERDQRDNAS